MTFSAIKKYIPLLVIIGLITAFWSSGYADYLSFETIKERRSELLNFVGENYIYSILIFALLYISAVALSLPIATVVVISATIGATIIFLIARSSFGAFLTSKAGSYYQRTKTEFQKNDLQYLLFLRLAPVFPFAVINILPALFNMKTTRFIIATGLGIIPGTTVYVYTGQSLGEIDKLSDIASKEVLSAFFLLALLSLMPIIIKKLKKKTDQNDSTTSN